jgi:DNA-binding Xre family transcriptional regulator
VTAENVVELFEAPQDRARPEVVGARWHVDLVRLDRERVVLGWTRSELARRAQVDPKTMSTMFRGRRRPVLGTVQAICVALGLELADVIAFGSDAHASVAA